MLIESPALASGGVGGGAPLHINRPRAAPRAAWDAAPSVSARALSSRPILGAAADNVLRSASGERAPPGSKSRGFGRKMSSGFGGRKKSSGAE